MKLCPKCQKQFSDDANFCPVDAARLVPLEGQPEAAPDADPLTQRFRLGERLGGARTGAVHKAVDLQTNAPAVVKLISPAVVALPGAAQRIERELKQLERVQSVGVTRVLASGRRGEDWWVATDVVEGAQTLAEAITARGPIPLEQAAHLVEVIGEALIEAAQVGVVHRDLAPKNVLFAGGEIKLINFSVPVPMDQTPGVPEFVAPEQVEGKAVDQRSNLYSLGALYYYVLTGQTVHAGPPEEVHRLHVSGSIRTPSSLAPVPAPVEQAIMRALDRSPTKRFLTVRQFVDEVARVARGEGGGVKTTLPMGKAGRPKAELVQTLLGMRPEMLGLPARPPKEAAAPSASAAANAPAAAAATASAAAAAGTPAAAEPEWGTRGPFMPPGAVMAVQNEPLPGVTMPGHGAAMPSLGPIEAPPMMAAIAAPDRSPWSAPGAVPPAAGPAVSPQPAAAAVPVAAAPTAAPAQPAAAAATGSPAQLPAAARAVQVEAAQTKVGKASSSNTTGSHKKKGDDKGKGKSTKGKFRETLWFKKGELDAQAAAAAAAERARTGKDTGANQADSLPMDERYKDDGSVSSGDKEKYSLRTGGTEMMPRLRDSGSSAKVSEDELIDEMKAGRGKILALIGLGLVVLIVIIIAVVA